MAMDLYLFTGPNRYVLREARRRWEDEFRRKHGPENLSRLDGARIDLRSLLDEVASAPFIAEKRLVCVDGTPPLAREDVERLPAAIHPACVLLISDPSPDRRTGGIKALLRLATVREFPLLPEWQLLAWIAATAREQGSAIQPAASALLLATVGSDQDALAQEIAKLALYAGNRAIATDDVELLAVPSGEQEVWHLSRLIAEGRRAEALRYARDLMERGEDAMALWNILLWVVRSLVGVWGAVRDGERNPARISASQKVPFPTAKTLLPLAGRLPAARVRALVAWAAEADLDLKTGNYRSTAEAPQEGKAIVDRLLTVCT